MRSSQSRSDTQDSAIRASVAPAALAALCLLFSAGPSAAECRGSSYRDFYRNGVQARDFGRWEEVVECMRAAIREKGNEDVERIEISGAREEPYIPHYHLGWALAELGELMEARDELQRSVDQGVSRRDRRYEDLVDRLGSIGAALADQRIREAEERRGQVLAEIVLARNVPEARQRFTRAEAELEATQRLMDRGDPALAAETAEEALADFQEVSNLVRQHLRTEIEELLDEGRKALDERAEVGGEEVQKLEEEFLSYEERYGDLPLATTLAQLDEARDGLTQVVTEIEAISPPVPASLAEADDAYNARAYEKVLELLGASWQYISVERHRAEALILLAASTRALSRIRPEGGYSESDLTEYVEACLALGPVCRPDPKRFPPDFVGRFGSSDGSEAG